ncbi:interferon-induced transmembrane protein 5 [Latimeria chalumnae]|uniref:interferon-induced transmembrane protein 5 n=1 Tax=Latimeria chalumnae TaxID=7897 RepID=UPI0003C11AF0|nr:PREDICTED: interferon-induced transmembrane protein 5-like [Latimeria chalumnae]|eukprot:XP_006008252.1 PREDICTED: interferon-induced transmembrane protein 5-like [Latimeria chalumnae]
MDSHYITDSIPLSTGKKQNKHGAASTAVNMGQLEPLPRDHLLWSIFNTIYMNFCCLGFVALVFSVKARDEKVADNLEGAYYYGLKARWYNILAMCCNILVPMLVIALIITGVVQFSNIARGSYNLFTYENYKEYIDSLGK